MPSRNVKAENAKSRRRLRAGQRAVGGIQSVDQSSFRATLAASSGSSNVASIESPLHPQRMIGRWWGGEIRAMRATHQALPKLESVICARLLTWGYATFLAELDSNLRN
jgi:hypothetical protein